MKHSLQKLSLLVLMFCTVISVGAQDYPTLNEQAQRLRNLANSSNMASLKSLTKTQSGKDIWMLTLGTGDMENKPAIAVVGGVEGSHLLGVEMAIRFAEGMINDHAETLNSTTFYVFPNMSPDAYEQYFAAVKWERSGNAKDTDDDRDGKMNEDPFEDIDANGKITMMRVADVTGDWITHPADDRVMIKADKSKGEKGQYKLYSEGTDNDNDGFFNEDGVGGIHFNKSLTFQYEFFKPGTGEYPVSEPENRALLDELYSKWNVYAIFTFGPGNNLSSPWRYNPRGASQRIVTSIQERDAELNKLLSDEYNKTVGLKDAPSSADNGGDFYQWAYFHFGRLSLSTPGWWVPQVKGDSTMKANTDKNREVNFLRWAAKEGLNGYFTDWKRATHPDFMDQQVEIGGISPFAMINPPVSMIGDVAKKHNQFIADLAAKQAGIEVSNLKVEAVGKGMTRITVDLYNPGTLPTHTEMGSRSRWLRNIKVELKLGNGQQVVSGRKIQLLGSIGGDSSERITWLVKGSGSLVLEAGAPHIGFVSTNVNLK